MIEEDILESEIILDDKEDTKEMVFDANDFENSSLFEENKVPDNAPVVVEEYNDLGVSNNDMKSLMDYVSGKGERPLFIDKYTASCEDKLRDLIYMISLKQLANIPQLMDYSNKVKSILYSDNTIYQLEQKDLMAINNGAVNEINSAMSNTVKMMQMFNQMGSLNSQYRRLLDKLVLMPEDKVNKIMDIINEDKDM